MDASAVTVQRGDIRLMDDLISRQAVLEATSTTLKITGKENAETVYGYIKKLCDDIKALPSAQEKGEWLYDEEREATGIYAICSCCDEKVYQCGEWLFCPRCGADMREER